MSAPSRSVIREIEGLMLRHWRAGLRDADLHRAVRAECSATVTLQEYNHAAELAWAEIKQAEEEAA